MKQAQIRFAQSGHSYHYSDLSTVQHLMYQIRKDFKIQLQDQKIIVKTGETLKSSMSFDMIQDSMKKTLQTNNVLTINNNLKDNSNQITQIQCLYIYNQKQLLKPIQIKNFSDDYYLNLLKQRCKQMSPLSQNSFEYKQFQQKINKQNINLIIQNFNKRLKNPIQNITQKYSKLLQNINQRNYLKLQIQALLDLIQNQQKARKLLIRNIQYIAQKKIKKKLLILNQKFNKQKFNSNQQLLKQNSGFFSGNKQFQLPQQLAFLFNTKQAIQKKIENFYLKLKQNKTNIVKKKFKQQQKLTFQIDKKKNNQNQKQYEQIIKNIKTLYQQFCEQTLKINLYLIKNKQKQTKQIIFKQLLQIYQQILNLQNKINMNIQQFVSMFLNLSKMHNRGETQHIKYVFEIYVQMIKSLDDIDNDIKKLQKQYIQYKSQQQIKISQFNQNKYYDLPLKRNQISNLNEQNNNNKSNNQQDKQKQKNIPNIITPNKNKISKNHIKNNNQDIIIKNNTKNNKQQQNINAIKQNKQLLRRFYFNKRIKSILNYYKNISEKQQQNRRNFRNSKQFHQNKLDILINFNVPHIQIDYNQTSDIQLMHSYQKIYGNNNLNTYQQIQKLWEQQVIQNLNQVNRTLTIYLASKSNSTQRQKNIEKILNILSETFYKIMLNKIQHQKQIITVNIRQKLELQYKNKLQSLNQTNIELNQKLWKLQEQLQNQQSSIRNNNMNMNMKQIQQKQNQLLNINQALQQQNYELSNQIKQLQQKLHQYQNQMDQITQKLIIIQQSNNQQIQQLKHHIKLQKQINQSLNKQITILNKQIKQFNNKSEQMKKNILNQVQTNQTLYKEIIQLTAQRQIFQKDFAHMKNIFTEKQILIIKLQNQLKQIKQNKNIIKFNYNQENQESLKEQSNKQYLNDQDKCHCGLLQQNLQLKQDKQQLQNDIQQLQKQLKSILFKQTQEQQIQTEMYEQQRNNNKNKQLINLNYNMNQLKQNNLLTNQITTKQIQFTQNNWHIENPAISQYYISGQPNQWAQFINAASKYSQISIGKTIQQGFSHIFLPFSNDLYIGVTINEDYKNYTNYQQYINNQESLHNQNHQTVYILDLKQFNQKTYQMLTECSLVLIVKVQKKQQFNHHKKIMVKGKIQYAFGFQDQDMTIKNYSNFFDE